MSASSNKKVRAIKAALALRGLTLGGWARVNGYRRNTVWNAVNGRRHGAVSRDIREKLEDWIHA